MMIDEKTHEPYYETEHYEPDLFKSETVKLEDGSYASRQVKIEGKRTVTRQTPEECGWAKKLAWNEIITKIKYRKVEGSEDLEPYQALVLMSYEVNAEKTPCKFCIAYEQKFGRLYDYLKLGVSCGIIFRCFLTDFSDASYLRTENKHAFKFLGERKISETEAKELIVSKRAWCGDFGLRQRLQIPNNL